MTMAVAAYFALMVTLPLLLYQLYAFVIPALSKNERRVAIPTMVAAPLLFLAGAVFTYFAVLPPAVHFLQGYNSASSSPGPGEVLLQVRDHAVDGHRAGVPGAAAGARSAEAWGPSARIL